MEGDLNTTWVYKEISYFDYQAINFQTRLMQQIQFS